MALPDGFDLDDFVTRTLAEDLGTGGDVTSAATIPAEARFTAEMNCREAIVLAGLEIAAAFFRALDASVTIELFAIDGDRLDKGTVPMRLCGNARAMLTAERSALNTLQHLSGIATLTRLYVDAIDGTRAVLLDTRKTIPGLRVLEKYAARMGGAHNHRMRLDDAVLIKDNHVAVCGGVGTGSRRSSPRWPQAPTGCCSTTCRPRFFAKRSHWSPAGLRSKHPAASRSTTSAASLRPASTSSRSGGSRNRRQPSTSVSIMR
jgi:nicotinate-nucleotide pyrophosphorylase (carboxylating)